jgi:uncharacterized membrane protein YsdA (DUF1294 family)
MVKELAFMNYKEHKMRKRVFIISFIGILIVVAGIIGIIVSDMLFQFDLKTLHQNNRIDL